MNNNLKYGGIYWTNNLENIGKIYLRFFRNGTISYLITSDIEEINDRIFNQMQRNFSKKIDVVKYHLFNNVIDFFIDTRIGVLQLSGEINNNSLKLNIINAINNTHEVKNVIFFYQKKQYLNYNENDITHTKMIKSKKLKIKNKKTKEYIPGTPQVAHSYNGFSFRSIARWK